MKIRNSILTISLVVVFGLLAGCAKGGTNPLGINKTNIDKNNAVEKLGRIGMSGAVDLSMCGNTPYALCNSTPAEVVKWNGSAWVPATVTKKRFKGSRVSVGINGDIWLVTEAHQLWRKSAATALWEKQSMNAIDVGVGGNGVVWILGDRKVYYNDYSVYKLSGNKWVSGIGGGVAIDVDEAGNAWVVNSRNELYKSWGALGENTLPSQFGWTKQSITAKDVGISPSGTVYVISAEAYGGGIVNDFKIYKQVGSTWLNATGGGVAIDVDRNNVPWVVNSTGNLYKLNSANIWVLQSIKAADVGAGNGPSIVNSNTNETNLIYSLANNYYWISDAKALEASPKKMDVAPNGDIWMVLTDKSLWRYSVISQTWNADPFSVNDVGVSGDGTVYVISNIVRDKNNPNDYEVHMMRTPTWNYPETHQYINGSGVFIEGCLSNDFAIITAAGKLYTAKLGDSLANGYSSSYTLVNTTPTVFSFYALNIGYTTCATGQAWALNNCEPAQASGYRVCYKKDAPTPWFGFGGQAIAIAATSTGVPWSLNGYGDVYEAVNGLWVMR